MPLWNLFKRIDLVQDQHFCKKPWLFYGTEWIREERFYSIASKVDYGNCPVTFNFSFSLKESLYFMIKRPKFSTRILLLNHPSRIQTRAGLTSCSSRSHRSLLPRASLQPQRSESYAAPPGGHEAAAPAVAREAPQRAGVRRGSRLCQRHAPPPVERRPLRAAGRRPRSARRRLLPRQPGRRIPRRGGPTPRRWARRLGGRRSHALCHLPVDASPFAFSVYKLIITT